MNNSDLCWMSAAELANAIAKKKVSPVEVVDSALGPIGRYSRPEEQGWPLVLMCSPRMSYVTGEVLWTDGGFFGAVATGRQQTVMGPAADT